MVKVRFLLVAVLIVTLLCLVVACNSTESIPTGNNSADQEGQNPTQGLSYELTEDGDSYSVTGIGTANTSDVIIPGEYKGKPVIEIDDYAFANTQLTSIVVANSVKKIEQCAFYECYSLKSVTLGDDIEIIEGNAFQSCVKLRDVSLGEKVESIAQSAFLDCTDLQSIYYRGDIANWCSKNWHMFIMFNGRTLYINNKKLEGNLNIPNGVTIIGDYAFAYQVGISSVTIPNTVKSIGADAFRQCIGLISITIPESVTNIGGEGALAGGTFYECYKLVEVFNRSNLDIVAGTISNGNVANYAKHVYTEEGNSRLTTDDNGFVFYYDGKVGYLMGYRGTEKTIKLPESFTAYDGTKIDSYEIYDYAFYGCNIMESINISVGVESIGKHSFSNCDNLENVVISNTVYKIGSYAFYKCKSLQNVEFSTSKNWQVSTLSDFSNYTILLNSNDVANSSRAAEYIREKYVVCFWKRNDIMLNK